MSSATSTNDQTNAQWDVISVPKHVVFAPLVLHLQILRHNLETLKESSQFQVQLNHPLLQLLLFSYIKQLLKFLLPLHQNANEVSQNSLLY